MLKLRSIETIRKGHNFVDELCAMPAVEWATPKQLEDYDNALNQTVGKLRTIDSNVELIISNPDENIRLALRDAYYLERGISVKELKFPKYLPQGKVQIQRDVIRLMVKVAKGKESVAKDINKEINETLLQGEWDANPKIGVASIDDKETELRLHNSLKHFTRYLNACEHEFYKQALATQLNHILHYYHMVLQDAEFREGKKPQSKLIEEGNYILNYSNLENVTDAIYYHRARDYLVECRDFWSFLDGNEYSRRFLIRMEDVHPGLKTKLKS